MKRKRLLLILAGLALAWLATLGVHSSQFVRAYCHGHERYGQPEVYVFMDPIHATSGVALLHTRHEDVLPYPLEIAVTVDDRTAGDGVVIESLTVVFADGERASVIAPARPRGGPFAPYEPLTSDQKPGRTYRRAMVGVPEAIWRRGSFQMSISGYIYGGLRQPFERTLRMDYSREFSWATGWLLYVIAPAC